MVHLAAAAVAFVGIRQCRYWVAVEVPEDGLDVAPPGGIQRPQPSSVLGVTGLYSLYGDSRSLWLGWTCVEQHARGRGIGRRLIDFATEQAGRSGAQLLKLYTTDLADQRIAVQTYERRGFVQYRSLEARHRDIAFRYTLVRTSGIPNR